MKTFLIAILGAAVLVLPAGAVAKPDHADKRAAIKQCKAERGKTKATHKAFKAKYHSFSRCVRQNAAEEHAEKQAALQERGQAVQGGARGPGLRRRARRQDVRVLQDGQYGKNAYGKCVSTKAREHKKAEDAGRRSGGPGLQERRQGVRRGAVGPRLPRRARRQVVRGLLREQSQQAQRVRQVRLEQGADRTPSRSRSHNVTVHGRAVRGAKAGAPSGAPRLHRSARSAAGPGAPSSSS